MRKLDPTLVSMLTRRPDGRAFHNPAALAQMIAVLVDEACADPEGCVYLTWDGICAETGLTDVSAQAMMRYLQNELGVVQRIDGKRRCWKVDVEAMREKYGLPVQCR